MLAVISLFLDVFKQCAKSKYFSFYLSEINHNSQEVKLLFLTMITIFGSATVYRGKKEMEFTEPLLNA